MKPPTTTHQPIIGILSPGEMGAALAKVLLDRGFDVITTLAGRSRRSAEYCEQSGVATRKCLADVVSEADVIISTVTPAAAVAVASQVGREAARLDASLIYVDANSVSPQTIGRIADEFQDSNVQFVDVALHGLASRLKTQATLFVSGSASGVVSGLFGTDIRVRILGNEPGNASLMKMTLGGMSKGIIGLFLQSSLLAQHVGMADEFCDELRHYYPDISKFVERSLPTYGQHAARRAAEMRELEISLNVAGLPTGMAVELSRLFSALNESNMAADCVSEVQPVTLKRLIEILSKSRLAVMTDRLETAVV
ncbi:MAG: NAD(P)-binding domain-containing protein [Planctomycetota bacterium]|nr:NAD(P)-binding domain-containing protein [Planctomycetota bacterium]